MKNLFSFDWEKRLNLNTYKWWRRHRKVVTYGGFLLAFSWYLSPLIQEAKNKNLCVKTISSIFLQREDFKLDTKKFPLETVKNLAISSAYMACSNNTFK